MKLRGNVEKSNVDLVEKEGFAPKKDFEDMEVVRSFKIWFDEERGPQDVMEIRVDDSLKTFGASKKVQRYNILTSVHLCASAGVCGIYFSSPPGYTQHIGILISFCRFM